MIDQKLANLVQEYRDADAYEVAVYRKGGCDWAYASTLEGVRRRIERIVRGRWDCINRIVFEENTPRETLLYDEKSMRNH